uniref:Replication-associated protein n=1 Tax=Cressdnavirus D_HF4_2562 TaxID=3071201 RepID=A0AA50KJ22_9VIRU|nr:replication-associated protein [Cressdnavirus D_HF4_2562]
MTLEEARKLYMTWAKEANVEVSHEVAAVPDFRNQYRKRCWFCTINNPTHEDWNNLIAEETVYTFGQVEVGKESGIPHIHAVLYYRNAVIKPVKRLKRADLEITISVQGALAYVEKSDTRIIGPFEKGTRPQQGTRTDLTALARKIIKEKTPPAKLHELDPGMFVKYHRGLTLLAERMQEHRTDKATVMWRWGLAGVGKTRYAFDKHGRDNCYMKDGTKWWYDYEQQVAIVVDDFDGMWPFRDWLRFLDRYKYMAQTKGGSVKVNSPYVYITCEFPPEHFWSGNELAQVMRRIDEVVEVVEKEEGGPPAAPPAGPVDEKVNL